MLSLFLDGGFMTGENTPPGHSSPPTAGASSSIELSVGHRAVWIKPSILRR